MSSAVKKLSNSADTLKFQSLNDSVSRVTSSIDPFKSAVEENAKKLLEAADGSNVFEEALGSLGEKKGFVLQLKTLFMMKPTCLIWWSAIKITYLI